MHQLITEDTRHRNESSSQSLDLLFTKDPSSIEQLRYLAPIGASDHDGIDFQLPYIKDSQIIKSQKILYNKGNYDKLRSILHNTDWDLLFQQGSGDIQTVYCLCKNFIFQIELKQDSKFNQDRRNFL